MMSESLLTMPQEILDKILACLLGKRTILIMHKFSKVPAQSKIYHIHNICHDHLDRYGIKAIGRKLLFAETLEMSFQDQEQHVWKDGSRCILCMRRPAYWKQDECRAQPFGSNAFAILLACKKLYRSATHILYNTNTFMFGWETHLYSFISSIGRLQGANLRILHFTTDIYSIETNPARLDQIYLDVPEAFPERVRRQLDGLQRLSILCFHRTRTVIYHARIPIVEGFGCFRQPRLREIQVVVHPYEKDRWNAQSTCLKGFEKAMEGLILGEETVT